MPQQLVGAGRDAFEYPAANACVLADHPMVQAIGAGQVDRFALAAEAIEAAAAYADEVHDDEDEAL